MINSVHKHKLALVFFLVSILLFGMSSSLARAQDTDPNKLGFKKTFIEVTEGEIIEVVVALDSPSEENISVGYRFEDIEARAERDYLDLSGGTVTIPTGELQTIVSINIVDNSKVEEEESFRILLSNPLLAGTPSAELELNFRKGLTILILDNDNGSKTVLQDFENKQALEFETLEVALNSPLTLPNQEGYENVLSIQASDTSQVFKDNFVSRQNWQDSNGLSFWYYGDNAGDITVSLNAVDPVKYEQSLNTEWKLLWQDEFDAAKGTLPNEEFWTIELGDGAGWGNSEHQYYTSEATNIFQDGQGNLVIRAEKLPEDSTLECYYGPCKYTSARIKTEDKFDIQYGRIEGRMKISGGQGFWPAFWMLGNNFKSINWPYSGEIDIMENIGREPTKIHGTVHGPGYSGGNGPSSTAYLPNREDFADDFHTYAIEWEQDEIRWYLDGSNYHTLRPEDLPQDKEWVFDHPFFILLNLAVGGSWPGYPNASSEFPQDFIIDYVRVYELPEVSSSYTLSPNISTTQDSKWQKITLPLEASIPESSLKEVWNYSLSFPASTSEQYIDRIELINQ